MEVLDLEVIREPYSGVPVTQTGRQKYRAAAAVMNARGSFKWIQIGFSPNEGALRRQRFSIEINAKHYEDLARMMIEADPQAAIKAFGNAMLRANIVAAPAKATEAA